MHPAVSAPHKIIRTLAWSVYSSKDFSETKTVTGSLCAPDPEYSQRDPDLH